MLHTWICSLVLAAAPVSAPVSSPVTPATTSLTAEQIIQKLVARDKVLVARRKAFDYDVAITRQKLGYDGSVTETLRDSVLVTENNGPSYNTRSGDGSPDEEQRKTAREEPFELLKIIDHYNYTLEGEQTVDGVACYRIRFTPKPDQPYTNREEKVLNNVSGLIWAAKSDFSLIKDEGSLLRPVSVAWIFATLREMEFRFDAMLMPNGDYGPGHLQYRYLVSIPFGQLSERDTRVSSNYRPAKVVSEKDRPAAGTAAN